MDQAFARYAGRCAALRNAIPQVRVLPVGEVAGRQLLHTVSACEWDRFEIRQSVEWSDMPLHHKSFAFLARPDAVTVCFSYDGWHHGQPFRYARKRPLFTLLPGQTASFSINGRFICRSGPYYQQMRVNFAWLCSLEPCVFLEREPDHRVDMMADLF